MKIGIISFAHMHAVSYASSLKKMKDVTLVGIADENVERGEKYAKQFDTQFFNRYEDLLKTDVEAIIVTSENTKHYEHVLACAKAKKHVLCEKPLATTMEHMKEMIKVCEENGVFLGTAFPVRFNTPVAQAKKIIDEGKLGEILAIKGTNRGTNPGGWFVNKELSGGGAVLDHTVHVVDIIRWITGVEVKDVYAEIGYSRFSDIPIDDSGIITMGFTNGMFATLDCSWSRNDYYPTWGDVTLDIIGTKGTLKVDAFDQKINVYSNQNGLKWHPWGDDMDYVLLRNFITSVRDGRPPLATGYAGLKATEVALAAYESFEKKTTVILNH